MGYAQEQRRKTIEEIKARFVQAAKKDVGLNKTKLIANIMNAYGSTFLKANEYINSIKAEGFIVEDDYGLWLDKRYLPEEQLTKEKVEELLKQDICD